MDNPQTPATEAGRRHLRTCPADWLAWETREVAAIEAEARADGMKVGRMADVAGQSYDQGRADALREAAPVAKALAECADAYHKSNHYFGGIGFRDCTSEACRAVLAILDPQP